MRANDENSFYAYLYFTRLFQLADYNFDKSGVLIDPEKLYEATAELEKISRLMGRNRNYTQYVDKWLAKYITEKGWQRCLNALKQKRHRENKRKVHIDISYESFYILEDLAQKNGMTKKALLEKIIKDADEQVQKEKAGTS